MTKYVWQKINESINPVSYTHLDVYKRQEAYRVGNIYVGKVKNIVPNIQAAFIEIANGVECYYSIPQNPSPHFTQKVGKKPLCICLLYTSSDVGKGESDRYSSIFQAVFLQCVLLLTGRTDEKGTQF